MNDAEPVHVDVHTEDPRASEHGDSSRPPFDVFLSHNSRDKPVVERLAGRLRGAGLEPWLDIWALTPGGRWQDEIVDGLRACSACAVFVGPHGLGDWVREELAVALDRAAKDRRFRLFLVLLPGVPEPFDPTVLPPFLSTRTWVDLRSGIDDPRAVQGLFNAVRGVAPGPAPASGAASGICPYRGLQPFDAEHAEFFFGRDADIQRLIERLKETRFLAVLGSSGTGKSSLVRAGLVPALRSGRLPGSAGWLIETIKPGVRPLIELAATLVRLPADAGMQGTLDGLSSDERTLDLAAALALAGHDADDRFLLVVDQFEEVFTLCADDRERERFLDNLVHAATVPGGRCVVVLTLRADFYPRCAAWPQLAALTARHQYLVSPMAVDELREAIEEPAHRVGLEFEEGLVPTILDDVLRQPGALPLLEHALFELWEQRSGTMLTLEAYRRTGGVAGALARRADLIYDGFNNEQQEMVKRVLLRLTQPGEGTEDTRRRASMRELLPHADDVGDLETVVQSLINARLLTATASEASAERAVDVAHEALIRGWPRLRAWIDEDRAGLREFRRISDAALEWDHHERDESILFRGTRLATALEWRQQHDEALNDLEREFLDAGDDLRSRERRAAQRRVRLAVTGLATALVIIAVAAVVAFSQRDSARASADRAERERANAISEASQRATAEANAIAERDAAQQARNVAYSRELAASSLAALPDDPQLSLLLALEALKVVPSGAPVDDLRQILLEAPRWVLSSDEEALVSGSAVSPDGTLVVTIGYAGTVRLWDAHTGQPIASLAGHTNSVRAAVFSPDGTQLTSVDDDGVGIVWDVAARKHLHTLTGHTQAIMSVSYSPDGSLIVTVGDDGTARVWDAVTGAGVAVLSGAETPMRFAVFSLDGSRLVTVNQGGSPIVWDPHSGQELGRFEDIRSEVDGLYALPNSNLMVGVGANVIVRVWDIATGALVASAESPESNDSSGAAFSPDGTSMLLIGVNGYAAIWDTHTWTQRILLRGHQATLTTAAWSADGRLAVTTSFDGTARLWDMTNGQSVAVLRGHREFLTWSAFSPTDRQVVTAAFDGEVHIYAYDALNATTDQLITLARERLTRDLTAEERARYLRDTQD